MLNKIKKELKRLNVGVVYIFGSTTQGIARDGSDLDIGVVFTNEGFPRNRLQSYEELYMLFSDKYRSKETDIVFLQDADLTLQLNAINHGKVMYQISPQFRANYEERVILLYSDFEPVLREFQRGVLERI